ncbi:MAG: SPOR domain-containing protein [Pseudomonadota bacterium]
MERATQERLVGATLLIMAGVILIPWLLDGDVSPPAVNETPLVLPGSDERNSNETRRISLETPRNESRSAPVTLDTRSVRDVDTPAPLSLPAPVETVDAGPAAPDRADTATPAQTSGAEEERRAEATVPARFARAMPPDDESTPAPPVDVAREPAVSEPVTPAPSVSQPAATPPPASTPTASVAESGWAVQVGSFASEANARRLTAQLQDKSYRAFITESDSSGRTLYRVRVGPVAERDEAELLAAALREDRQPARVLRHR